MKKKMRIMIPVTGKVIGQKKKNAATSTIISETNA
jgi:hypothetical protein